VQSEIAQFASTGCSHRAISMCRRFSPSSNPTASRKSSALSPGGSHCTHPRTFFCLFRLSWPPQRLRVLASNERA
jgi:hypothetical protein